MHVVIAGASGFLGTHLTVELVRRGHRVTALVRRPPGTPVGPAESSWDPATGRYDRGVLDTADAVVNLAGSPTIGNPHSASWAHALRESRVRGTEVLARAVAEAARRPAYLAGNGISWYGDHGAAELTEASDSRGHALLTRVTREWQAATGPAVAAGARVCVLRTAPVFDHGAAPLKQLRLLFRAGLGARLGTGRQHLAMISLRDWVGAVAHLVEDDAVRGPVNLCCSRTPTNAEFTRALARRVNRPALLAVPGPLLRVAAGPMAPELLGSLNVRPAALEASGYVVRDPDVESVLAAALPA